MIPKFRAWDKRRKEMWKVATLHIEDEYADLFKTNIYEKPFDNPWAKFDDLILMQSTGLKDKNGVEIFEGDVVAFEDSDGGYEYQDIVINTGIVEYGELGFYFTNRVAVDMDDFYIKDGRCDDVEVIGNIYENSEVIGNIYENSELLSQGIE